MWTNISSLLGLGDVAGGPILSLPLPLSWHMPSLGKSLSHVVQTHLFQVGAGQKGRGACPRTHSSSQGTLGVRASLLPSSGLELTPTHTPHPTLPHPHGWGCSSLLLPPFLLPALPRPASAHLSPHLLPKSYLAFFFQPLEPGEAPHLLLGQCCLLYCETLPLCSWGSSCHETYPLPPSFQAGSMNFLLVLTLGGLARIAS